MDTTKLMVRVYMGLAVIVIALTLRAEITGEYALPAPACHSHSCT